MNNRVQYYLRIVQHTIHNGAQFKLQALQLYESSKTLAFTSMHLIRRCLFTPSRQRASKARYLRDFALRLVQCSGHSNGNTHRVNE